MAAEPNEPPTDPEQYSSEVVDRMAAEMPARQGVWWACQSCRQVEPQLPLAELQAVESAEQWVKQPDAARAASAAAVLENSDFQGPGAWAAQGAVWAQRGAQAPATEGGAASSLAPKAIAGSVKLAAAASVGQMPAWEPALSSGSEAVEMAATKGAESAPSEATQVPKTLKPFIELGQAIASGANVWA